MVSIVKKKVFKLSIHIVRSLISCYDVSVSPLTVNTNRYVIFMYNISSIVFVVLNLSQPADFWLYKYLFEACEA